MNQSAAPRKRPSQSRSLDTVDAILVAAARIFGTWGWEKATTNRIAEAAGVSIGSLYQYFPNKLALLASVKRRFQRDLEAEIEERLVSPDRALEQKMREALRLTIRSSLAQRDLLLVVAEHLPRRVKAGVSPAEADPHLPVLQFCF
jgi:AcrR family transcriptional regulator